MFGSFSGSDCLHVFSQERKIWQRCLPATSSGNMALVLKKWEISGDKTS